MGTRSRGVGGESPAAEKGTTGTAERAWPAYGRILLLCLGLGCLLSTYSGAPLGSTFIPGWQEALLLQTAFQAGIALGCVLLGVFVRRRHLALDPIVSGISYAAMAVLCLIAENALAAPILSSSSAISAAALSLVFGLASALPLLFWYDQLLEIRRVQGKRCCILLIALAEFVSISAFVLLTPLLPEGNEANFVAMLVFVIVAATSQIGYELIARPSKPGQSASAQPTERYRLTSYSASMIVCLGVGWGFTCSMFLYMARSNSMVIPPLAIFAVASVALLVIVVLTRVLGGRQFGTLVRLSIGVTGIVLAAFPLFNTLDSTAFYPPAQFLLALIDVSIMFFSIDICAEKGLRISSVMPVNYALFLLTSCAMALVFWLIQTLIGGQTSFEIIALCGVVSVAAVVMFLPSRESSAAVFALDALPEDVSFETTLAQRRTKIVVQYGLLEREAEVLELLFRGMTRQQIADELHLSPWTIKDRVSAIYEKTGVHSYKELARLLEDDA